MGVPVPGFEHVAVGDMAEHDGVLKCWRRLSIRCTVQVRRHGDAGYPSERTPTFCAILAELPLYISLFCLGLLIGNLNNIAWSSRR